MLKSEVTIRSAELGDEHALALVGAATFLETFAGVLGGRDIISHCSSAHTIEKYGSWLKDSRCALWLVEHSPDGAPIGYCVLSPSDLPVPDPSPNDVELKRIYVLSKFRGAGIGRHLVERVRDRARETGACRLLLGVYAHNRDARAFYERVGFVQVGTRKFVVGERAYDDVVMALNLA